MKTHINKEMVTALFILMMNLESAGSKENRMKNPVAAPKAVDSTLKVEDWMTDEKTWTPKTVNNWLVQESDRELSIEDWMINENFPFGGRPDLVVSGDSAMQIESWMTDNKNWKMD